jgi:hypothetical protein
VVRFRKGHYRFDEAIATPWSVNAAHVLAKRLIAEDEAAYKRLLAEREAYYRALPPLAPPVVPAPPVTQQKWEQTSGLEEVELERVDADTVHVRITGHVMLDGGCASAMPMLQLDVLGGKARETVVPMPAQQLDCGLPTARWHGHVLALPVAQWAALHGRTLDAGTYRLILQGADGRTMTTHAFVLGKVQEQVRD